MRMRKLLTVGLMLLTATIGFAQSARLRGKVLDKDGLIMPGATVKVYQGSKLVVEGTSSNTGDFELTVSKGPGITLLSLRQDASFAEVKGAFTRQGWSGPTSQAPPQLRGWLALRDQFLHAPNQKVLRYTTGDETFVFRL